MQNIKKAVFPVGGLGTRFLPVTKSSPKEMLPIVDKPLILYAVEEAQKAGIEEFIFVTGRGKSAIEDFFDHSYELTAELQKRRKEEELALINDFLLKPGQISYIRQQEPLGLGHAVWCARHLIGNEPFAVLLADDLIMSRSSCLEQMCRSYQSGNMVALMSVARDDVNKYGILDVENVVEKLVYAQDIVEKPSPQEAPSTMAVIGRYILDPRIFEILERQEKGIGGEIQLTDALRFMLRKNVCPLTGFLFEGNRFDCGTRPGFLEATIAFALAREDLKEDMKAILKGYSDIRR